MKISGTFVYIADDLPKWPLPDWITRTVDNWAALYHLDENVNTEQKDGA